MATPTKEPQYYYQRSNSKLLVNIPPELTKAIRYFVVWEEKPPETTGNKYKKIPLNPLTLKAGDWNNPANSCSRASVMEIFAKHEHLRGIGFILSLDDPFFFFDLDKVIVKGKLLPWAQELVTMCDSYTEISQTGTGIKILIKAKLGDRRKHFLFKDANGEEHECECYDANRFFAATGNMLPGTPPTIRENQHLVDTLLPEEVHEAETNDKPYDRKEDDFARTVDEISDDKLIEKILSSSQGKKFRKLPADSSPIYFQLKPHPIEGLPCSSVVLSDKFTQ
jgi:putative DNA primase/helicase